MAHAWWESIPRAQEGAGVWASSMIDKNHGEGKRSAKATFILGLLGCWEQRGIKPHMDSLQSTGFISGQEEDEEAPSTVDHDQDFSQQSA